jgi:hypothetical protein
MAGVVCVERICCAHHDMLSCSYMQLTNFKLNLKSQYLYHGIEDSQVIRKFCIAGQIVPSAKIHHLA